MSSVILGIGSNIGDRKGYLAAAIGHLAGFVDHIRQSRIYECAALLPPDAPAQWDISFLNMAIIGETSLDAEALLFKIKHIERDMGRQVRGFWGPREIDIDILAMDGLKIETPMLTIPHHELLNRDFALLPLVDVAPGWVYSGDGGYKGWKAADIAAALGYKTSDALLDRGMLSE